MDPLRRVCIHEPADQEQQGTFANGGAFVSLAPVVGREQMVSTIADALGLVLYSATDRADQLIAALRAKALLLVLDNVEHLLLETACITLISNLIRDAPGVKLLVTSREPLRLQAEWVFEVQGLPLPESADPDALEASSAARLFLQRARQAQASFILAAEEREAVRRICALVAGLPLGIELAAAWVATLSCEEIAREIQCTMDFLASTARDVTDRHRSIRAAFDHSWALLSAEEQHILRNVAVFRGGFGREAAEYVAGATLPLLSALVSKSLLRRTPVGRYDLHDLVRQYALDQLDRDAQAADEVRTRRGNLHCPSPSAVTAQPWFAHSAPKSQSTSLNVANGSALSLVCGRSTSAERPRWINKQVPERGIIDRSPTQLRRTKKE